MDEAVREIVAAFEQKTAAIQTMTQPQLLDMDVRDNEWCSGPIWE